MRASLSTTTTTTITSLIILTLTSLTTAQFASTLPPCWQTCMSQHVSPKCPSATDTTCLCHFTTTPSLLTPLLTCLHTSCPTNAQPSLLGTPLRALQSLCKDTPYRLSDAFVANATSPSSPTTLTPTTSISTDTNGVTSAPTASATGSFYDTTAEQNEIFAELSSSLAGVAAASQTSSSGPAATSGGSQGKGDGKGDGSGGTMLDVYQGGAAAASRRMGMGKCLLGVGMGVGLGWWMF